MSVIRRTIVSTQRMRVNLQPTSNNSNSSTAQKANQQVSSTP